MTPRGHSSISDAVETELQILATERPNITSLLCTKGRRTRGIRKDWRRDFLYDEDSFTLTPVDEYDETKSTVVSRLKIVKAELDMSDRELGDLLSVNFSTVARWLRDENLPVETRLPKIREIVASLEQRLQQSVASENATNALQHEGSQLPYKDIEYIEGKVAPLSATGSARKAKNTAARPEISFPHRAIYVLALLRLTSLS